MFSRSEDDDDVVMAAMIHWADCTRYEKKQIDRVDDVSARKIFHAPYGLSAVIKAQFDACPTTRNRRDYRTWQLHGRLPRRSCVITIIIIQWCYYLRLLGRGFHSVAARIRTYTHVCAYSPCGAARKRQVKKYKTTDIDCILLWFYSVSVTSSAAAAAVASISVIIILTSLNIHLQGDFLSIHTHSKSREIHSFYLKCKIIKT